MKFCLNKLVLKFFVFLSLAFIIIFFASTNNPNDKYKLTASTDTFQAGHIIDDNIFTNYSSLTEPEIQTWLGDMISGAGGCNAPGTVSTNPPNGACINEYCENTSTLQNNFSDPNTSLSCPQQIAGSISAAQIIYDAAQQYQINPEVILTTLQKEQGLITDTWPYYSEYQYAMGYACPSSCSSSYADFYEQVDGAAWQFRYYLNNPGAFNYWIGNNYISYAPSPCTSGSTVDIVNAATAALYIYTPYQPDSNVLANTNPLGSPNGPGPTINDTCATYGNRNFWWYFNTWFGPSIDTNVGLAEESGTSTVYVLYDGIKQGIPSPDVLNSWGLNGLPISSMDSSVFNSIPTASTVLSRYATDTSTNVNYFADNGNVYYVSPNDASIWNNFSGQSLSQVSSTLVNFAVNQGEIKPYVSVSGNNTFYIVNDGTLYPVTSLNAYNSFAGQNDPPIQLSSAYFNSMTQATTDVSSPEISVGSTNYVLSDGAYLTINTNTSALLPTTWNIFAIGTPLFNTFQDGGSLQYMVKANSSPTIYLLNSGTLMGIPNQQTYDTFQVGSSDNTTVVSSDLLSFIPTSTSELNSNIVDISNNPYVVNNGLQPIPANLTSAYNTSNIPTSLTSTYINLLPTTSNATPFVQSNSSPAIYFLDSGNKLPFSNYTTYSLVAGSVPTTNLTDGALNTFGQAAIMQNYVSNGNGTNYLIDNGNIYAISSGGIAAAWNLTLPVNVSSQAIAYFPSAGLLSQFTQIPDGHFCLIDHVTYCAQQSQLITMWGFGSVMHPSQTLLDSQNLGNEYTLTPFVTGDQGQMYAGTIFAAAKGQLIGITNVNAAINLGVTTSLTINLDTYTINSLLSNQVWQGYLAYDDSGNIWVLDGGVKQSVSSQYQTDWVGSNTPTLLGSDFLSLLPTGQPISDAIKSTSNPTVYGMNNGQAYSVPSEQVYASSGLAAYSIVSSSLINSIPYGGTWNF